MPTLSVCLIARNEASNIGRALRSIEPIADEIVLTDTGSDDETVEIARSFAGAVDSFVLERFDWCDDFSAARNHSLDHAGGDWILWLDADEELLSESCDEVRACIARDDALGYLVVRQDLAEPGRTDVYTQMWQLRLFRRRDDLRFIGRCHPDFNPPLTVTAAREGLSVQPSSITFRHWGYLGALKRSKLQRAAGLLALELQDRPGQFYYLVEYGRTLLALGDDIGHDVLAQAAAMVDDPHHADRVQAAPLAMLLEYALARSDTSERPFPLTRQRAGELARQKFPDAAPLIWHRAQHAYAAGDFAGCAAMLKRILELGRTHSYDHYVSFDPRILHDDALLNLGACYVRMGKLAQAKGCFKKLLPRSSRAAEAKRNLKAIEQVRRR